MTSKLKSRSGKMPEMTVPEKPKMSNAASVSRMSMGGEHDCHCEKDAYMCHGEYCASVHGEFKKAKREYMDLRKKLENRGITERDVLELWKKIVSSDELRKILESLDTRAPHLICSPICEQEGGCHDCNTFGNNDYEYVVMWSLFGQLLVWVDETNEFWKALRARGPVPGKSEAMISRAVSFRGVKYGKGCRVNLEDCFAPLRGASDEAVRATLATIPCQWAVDGKICKKGALGCCLNAHPEDHPLCIAPEVIEAALALKN